MQPIRIRRRTVLVAAVLAILPTEAAARPKRRGWSGGFTRGFN